MAVSLTTLENTLTALRQASSWVDRENRHNLYTHQGDSYYFLFYSEPYMYAFQATGNFLYLNLWLNGVLKWINGARVASSFPGSKPYNQTQCNSKTLCSACPELGTGGADFNDSYLSWDNWGCRAFDQGGTDGGEGSLFDGHGWTSVPKMLYVMFRNPSILSESNASCTLCDKSGSGTYQNDFNRILAFFEQNIWNKWRGRATGWRNLMRSQTHIASHYANMAFYLSKMVPSKPEYGIFIDAWHNDVTLINAVGNYSDHPYTGSFHSQVADYTFDSPAANGYIWNGGWGNTFTTNDNGTDTNHNQAEWRHLANIFVGDNWYGWTTTQFNKFKATALWQLQNAIPPNPAYYRMSGNPPPEDRTDGSSYAGYYYGLCGWGRFTSSFQDLLETTSLYAESNTSSTNWRKGQLIGNMMYNRAYLDGTMAFPDYGAGGGTIAVTGVTWDNPSQTIVDGQTVDLGYVVQPTNATNKSVNIVSSNPSVVSNQGGWVSPGSANLTVTTVDGGFNHVMSVTASQLVTPGRKIRIKLSHAGATTGRVKLGTNIVAGGQMGEESQVISNYYNLLNAANPNTDNNSTTGCDGAFNFSISTDIVENTNISTSPTRQVMFTEYQLDTMVDRWANGYSTAGTNGGEDISYLNSQTASFIANPNTDRFTYASSDFYNCTDGCAPVPTNVLNGAKETSDNIFYAGFQALIKARRNQGTDMAEAIVIANLIATQTYARATDTNLNFDNRTNWKDGTETNGYFIVAQWFDKYMHNWSFIKSLNLVTNLTSTQEATIDAWFLKGRNWCYDKVTNHYIAAFGSNWETSAISTGYDQIYPSNSVRTNPVIAIGGVPQTAYTVNSAGALLPWNTVSKYATVVHSYGLLYNDQEALDLSDRWYKDYFKLGMFTDGSWMELIRGYDTAPFQGLQYGSITLSSLTFMAHTQAVATRQDHPLLQGKAYDEYYTYTTSLGLEDVLPGHAGSTTGGSSKGLLLLMTAMSKYIGQATGLNAWGSVRQVNDTGFPTIEMTDTFHYFVAMAQANAYYNDANIRDCYKGTGGYIVPKTYAEGASYVGAWKNSYQGGFGKTLIAFPYTDNEGLVYNSPIPNLNIYYLKFTRSAPTGSTVSGYINLTGLVINDTYQVKIYANEISGVNWTLNLNNADGWEVTDSQSISSIGTWTEYTFQGKATSANPKIRVLNGSAGVPGHNIGLDNIRITKVNL